VCVCGQCISRLAREKNAFREGKTVRSPSAPRAEDECEFQNTAVTGKKTENKKRANIVRYIYLRAVYPGDGVCAGRVPTSF